MTTSGTMLDLRFQDAGANGGYLLEELLEACSAAQRGGGIFAWVNTSGSRALLEDETFVDFAKVGRFDLVVGMDSITDEAAVEALKARAEELSNVRIRAFVHNETGLFHPKL